MAQGQAETWISKAAAAYGADLSPQQFDAAIRPLLAIEATRKNGKILEFDLSAFVKACKEYDSPKAAADGDPLLSGSDSPNLERYRGLKADLTQIELDERKGSHVSLPVLDSLIVRFASLLRRAGEILQRRWGNEAADVFNEALDEALRIITAEFNARRASSDTKDS